MAGKMVQCKVCGEMIAKEAKVCPHCGAKRKKPVLGVVLLIVGILIVVAAVSGGNEPKKVGEVTSSEGSTAAQDTGKSSRQTVFGVGEQVELNDVIVTLLDVTKSNGKEYMKPTDGNEFILCEFEIENHSSSDITVSSVMSFDAYIDDYAANMSLTAQTATDKAQLDGTVAAGRKMNGVIGFEGKKGWQTIEIRFTPDFWRGSEIVFQAANP